MKSSKHMEKEGLKNALQFLAEQSLNSTLITDRHTQITKFVSQNYPDIDHRFDVWHCKRLVHQKYLSLLFICAEVLKRSY